MLPKPLIVEEEERLASFHRAANTGAELISAKWRRAFLLKKIARVESVVAQKLVNGPVEGICSGPGSSLPPVLDVFAVKQDRVPLRARTGNGVCRCTADERATASRGIRQCAGRQQDQLLEVPA